MLTSNVIYAECWQCCILNFSIVFVHADKKRFWTLCTELHVKKALNRWHQVPAQHFRFCLFEIKSGSEHKWATRLGIIFTQNLSFVHSSMTLWMPSEKLITRGSSALICLRRNISKPNDGNDENEVREKHIKKQVARLVLIIESIQCPDASRQPRAHHNYNQRNKIDH